MRPGMAERWRIGLGPSRCPVQIAALALGYASTPHRRSWVARCPRLKWPVIALAWGLVAAASSVPAFGCCSREWAAVEFIGVQTLFVAGITLPFDVRDLSIDPAELRPSTATIGRSVHHGAGNHVGRVEHRGLWGLDTSWRAIAGAVALVGIVVVPSPTPRMDLQFVAGRSTSSSKGCCFPHVTPYGSCFLRNLFLDIKTMETFAPYSWPTHGNWMPPTPTRSAGDFRPQRAGSDVVYFTGLFTRAPTQGCRSGPANGVERLGRTRGRGHFRANILGRYADASRKGCRTSSELRPMKWSP